MIARRLLSASLAAALMMAGGAALADEPGGPIYKDAERHGAEIHRYRHGRRFESREYGYHSHALRRHIVHEVYSYEYPLPVTYAPVAYAAPVYYAPPYPSVWPGYRPYFYDLRPGPVPNDPPCLC